MWPNNNIIKKAKPVFVYLMIYFYLLSSLHDLPIVITCTVCLYGWDTLLQIEQTSNRIPACWILWKHFRSSERNTRMQGWTGTYPETFPQILLTSHQIETRPSHSGKRKRQTNMGSKRRTCPRWHWWGWGRDALHLKSYRALQKQIKCMCYWRKNPYSGPKWHTSLIVFIYNVLGRLLDHAAITDNSEGNWVE